AERLLQLVADHDDPAGPAHPAVLFDGLRRPAGPPVLHGRHRLVLGGASVRPPRSSGARRPSPSSPAGGGTGARFCRSLSTERFPPEVGSPSNRKLTAGLSGPAAFFLDWPVRRRRDQSARPGRGISWLPAVLP